MKSENFAARAGRWSAQHRKKAILGWFAFVILATVLGGMVGTKTLSDEDSCNGESKRADQIVAAADFPDQSSESVIVQARGAMKASDPAFQAIVGDVVGKLTATKNVSEVEDPRDPDNAGNISKDGRSVLVTFKLPGEEDKAKDEELQRLRDDLAKANAELTRIKLRLTRPK